MEHILLGVILIAIVLSIKVYMEGRKDIERINLKIYDCQQAVLKCHEKSQTTQTQIEQEKEGMPELAEEVKKLEKKRRTLGKRAQFWDEKYTGKPQRKHRKDISQM